MPRILFLMAFLACALSLRGAEKVFDFAELKSGETPPGFRSAISGQGMPGEWKILADETLSALPPLYPNAPVVSKRLVLAQVARDKTDEHTPLLIYEQESFGDFALTTRFKLVGGEVEQMAGIAFRVQDERNYYYIRASGLGNSFYFFKIVDGLRSPPIGGKASIPSNQWHEMTIECKGTEIRALLNGKEIFPPLSDNTFSAGKIAFWTKSDSISYFAETRIIYTPRETLAQALVRESLAKYPRLQGLYIFAKTKPDAPAQVIGCHDANALGDAATPDVLDSMATGQIYQSKKAGNITVTMPLRDNNGDRIAAVKVVMKAFFGQTEGNAAGRALPIVKAMEGRIQKAKDLLD